MPHVDTNLYQTDLYQTDGDESLSLRRCKGTAPEHYPELGCVELEFSSRGDRVPGRLLTPPPETKAPYPLVLLAHGAGGSKDAPYVDAAAGPWARGGAAVLSIDFPLHGARRSAKMSERLLEIVASPKNNNDGFESVLWKEFVRQAVIDLRNAQSAAEALDEIDATRTVFASFSLGTIVGGIFCGVDSRPLAAALAIGGGGFGPAEFDPCQYIANFSPKPLLLIGAKHDERVPRVLTERLFEAAADPKEIAWYDVNHAELPGLALKRMWEFLRPALSL